MKSSNELHKLLLSLDGRPDDAAVGMKGEYDYGDFTLIADFYSRDSSKNTARLRARMPLERARFPIDVFTPKSRETAARDFIARTFHSLVPRYALKASGGVTGGRVFIDRPGQELLETSAVVVGDGHIEVRFTVEIPHRKRKIVSSSAIDLFIERIPALIRGSLVFAALDGEKLADWIETCEDADAARAQLRERNLVGFIAGGSMLPRRDESGHPLVDGAVRLEVPPELGVTLELPNRGSIHGLGIPAGITVITGARFQGKSTLIRALELGVYNHAPGDGREFAVTVHDAIGIRAEAGRSMERVDLSPFFGLKQRGTDMTRFSTLSATASESVAANIMEALETGTALLLIDEDAIPADMVGRDARMQELVSLENAGREVSASASLVDILSQLRDTLDVSAVIAVSGAGDYLGIADMVIAMKGYQPIAVTEQARRIVKAETIRRTAEIPVEVKRPVSRQILSGSFESDSDTGVRSGAKGRTAGDDSEKPAGSTMMHVRYGDEYIDVSHLSQIVNPSQVRALSRSLALVHRLIGGSGSLNDVVSRVMNRIEQVGLDTLSGRLMGDLCMFRAHELAATLNRMSKLRVK